MPFEHAHEHRDDNMLVVQANIDDMNPEFCSFVTDRLLAAGANDVYWIPIIMKKGRPGIMLNVLADAAKLEPIEAVIFAETSTLGLRYTRVACHRLGRSFERVETPWGPMTVKVGYHNGEMVQFAPENGECEQIAKTHGVPLKTVYDYVRSRYMKRRGDGQD